MTGMPSLFMPMTEFTGTVVNLIENFTDYGTRTFMTVQCDGGGLLFGTKPRDLMNVECGFRVRMVSRVDRDPKTNDGFFSFVRSAVILDEPQVPVPDATGVRIADASQGGDDDGSNVHGV